MRNGNSTTIDNMSTMGILTTINNEDITVEKQVQDVLPQIQETVDIVYHVVNMITTASMIKIGKVYENLMVDLKVSNQKLKERAKSMVSTITGVPVQKAEEVLEITNYEVKPAIVMIKTGVTFQQAKKYIDEADGFVRKAIELTL